MILRIALFIAILAGLGAGGMAYYEFANQIPALKSQRDSEHDLKVEKITQLNNTNKILKATLAKLADTQQELADTKADRDKAVAEYKAGKVQAINSIKGQAMKLSQGKANPQLVGEILARKLAQ